MGADILIVAETAGGRLPPVARELAAAGLELAARGSARLIAHVLGAGSGEAANELIGCGAERVFVTAIADLDDQVVDARMAPILAACRQVEPRVVLLPHSAIGAELAPRLAFRLDGAVATGLIDVAADGETVRCTRPCYGGVAREVDRFDARPVVATLRSGVFEPAPQRSGRSGAIVAIEPDGTAPRTRMIERVLDATEGVRLDDARAIVAGGRGLQGPEGFRVLEELAHELDGAVGASRVPCDLGWCPHSRQIGLTGKTVAPELYIAVGISGAGHHMAGCGNAKTIVAINTDPEAAIFRDARFGVIGDYREVVPALTAELRRLKQAR